MAMGMEMREEMRGLDGGDWNLLIGCTRKWMEL